MRVIAGSARSLRLETVDGMDTRPTTDRIKETLFNMLSNDISGCNFLDLYSGSGAIGIEALSRGAKHSIFVENNKKAIDCIKKNLQFTHLEDGATILERDVLSVVDSISANEEPFDIIFMDPPYNQEHEKAVLQLLKENPYVDEYTTIIVEASKETEFDYLDEMGFTIVKNKVYKTNKHVFIRRNESK